MDFVKEQEVFKDIKGYEGKYQISNYGRVWSIKNQKFLSQQLKRDGYYVVVLVNPYGKTKYERVHRLVALMFCDNPNNYTIVNHLDEDKTNNYYRNLEWTTVRGNTKYSYDKGSTKKAQQKATAAAALANTYTIKVYKDNKLVGSYYGKETAAKALGINPKTIYNCVKENRKTRQGYYFEVYKGGEAKCHK